MKKIIFLFFLILYCANLSAQNYYLRSLDLDTGSNITCSPYFNKSNKECTMICSTYLLDKPDSFNKYILKTHFIKFDSLNNKKLDKSFTLKNSSIFVRGTVKLYQGGYIGYGLYYDSKTLSIGTSGIQGCIVKYNDNGDTVFTKKFPYGTSFSIISSFRQLNDSSFVFVSILNDKLNTFSGIRVVKLNINFGITWDSTYYYGYSNNQSNPRPMDYVDAICQTSDKGFLIGTTKYIASADSMYRALVFKVDGNGKFLWEKTFYSNKYDFSVIHRITKLKDGNYLLIGRLHSNYNIDPKVELHIIAIKMNEQGQVLWKKLISVLANQYITDVDEFYNGNILLVGQSDIVNINKGYDPKAALICLNKNGNIIWSRQYYLPINNAYDEIYNADFTEVEIADDNSIMAAGNISTTDSSFPYNNGSNQDLLFLHADSLGCIMPGTCPITEIEQTLVEPNYFYAYPNPTSSTISFKSNLKQTLTIQIKIINALGQAVCEKKLKSFEEQIDVSSFNKGIYIVEFSVGEYLGKEKIIIE